MEGKAVLFKQFGGVDAWPVVLDTEDTEEIIRIVKAIAPAYGGINLEDISAPRCFEIEARLKEELDIRSSTMTSMEPNCRPCALLNALKVVDKKIEDVRIVVSGVGAAGTAIIKLLLAQGARDIVGYGRNGALSRDETEGFNRSRRPAEMTNPRLVKGSLKRGFETPTSLLAIAWKHPGAKGLEVMADRAVVFALANPTPEVDPVEAAEYAEIVATGRSDFPNQINNVLAFPGLFRGILDSHIKTVTTELLRVTATAIASVISEEELSKHYIIPGVFDERVPRYVSSAVRRSADDVPRHELPTQEHPTAQIPTKRYPGLSGSPTYFSRYFQGYSAKLSLAPPGTASPNVGVRPCRVP